MENSGDFFLEFMEPLVGGIWEVIKAVGSGLFRIFNIVNYIDVITKYKDSLNGAGVFLIIISVICLIALFGLIVYLIYRAIRKFVRYRHNVAHQDALVDEIENLNNDIIRLRSENQKYLQMTDPEKGEVEYDENGNIVNKLAEGESRFFKLTQIDERYEGYVAPTLNETISLKEFCEQFRNFAASQMGLYYTIDLIRLFISSFASNRLIILQGISGTGKTSLAYVFGHFIKNDATIASVQPSWRDSTEIFGYFNEFTKRFNETEVLTKMYEAKYNNKVFITVLDEMNISRVEYYFAEMLSILELPSQDEWVIDLVPNAWSSDPKLLDNGRFKLPTNMWYVGTINNDDSTFMITDKVYDRAMPINIDTKGVEFDAPNTEALDITSDYLLKLFEDAKNKYPVSEETLNKIAKMDDYVIEHFRLAFGNRIVKQLKDFVPVYVACGGDEIVAVDYLIANKILRKFDQLNLAYIRGEIDGFIEYLNQLFGQGVMKECIAFLERLKKTI
jgi:hypothetical protein